MINISKIIEYTIYTVLKCERPKEIHIYFRKSIEVYLVLSVLMYTFHNWENHWSFDGLELNNFRQSMIHDKQINFHERTHIYIPEVFRPVQFSLWNSYFSLVCFIVAIWYLYLYLHLILMFISLLFTSIYLLYLVYKDVYHPTLLVWEGYCILSKRCLFNKYYSQCQTFSSFTLCSYETDSSNENMFN